VEETKTVAEDEARKLSFAWYCIVAVRVQAKAAFSERSVELHALTVAMSAVCAYL
jgi:hypothetical protein